MAKLIFGLNVSTSSANGADPVAEARRAEALGFDFVSANDHPSGVEPTFEVWTMLTWIAARTSQVRVAPRVLGLSYRPPAMVAKMAETLNRLSGGRLILGMGGGSADDEVRAFGLPVPSPRQKVDGLAEAITIIRGLWSEPRLTFEGRVYRTTDAPLEPKPNRPIPVWLGTYGPRALDVTGRLADGWIPSLSFAPPDKVRALRDRVIAAAGEAGRPPSAITCIYNLEVQVGGGSERDEDVVAGSASEITDRLLGLVELGFDGFNFLLAPTQGEDQARLLASEVIPLVREAAGR